MSTRPLFVLLMALLLAACGGGGDDTAGGGRPAQRDPNRPKEEDRSHADRAVEANLEIRLERVGDKAAGTGVPLPKRLACDRRLPASCRGELACPGDDPDLCSWLARPQIQALLLEEPPKDEICTEIYGGPEVATVTGTLGDRPVDRTFSRTNGCEISRFDSMAPLWTGEVSPTGERSGSHPEPEVIDDPPEAFDY